MFISKTTNDAVKIHDARTGNLKCNIPIRGQMLGNAQVQGNLITVQLQEGNKVRTKVFDARTGNLKNNII